jgi:mono/diheme cytochrome c family protein
MFRKIVMGAAILFGAILVVIAIIVMTYKPKQRPASAEAFERTPARVERGRYLVEQAIGCVECHSKRDMAVFAGPIVGPHGAGSDCIGAEQGAPGKICFPNITPDNETGLGTWTDGEILRAIREGVSRDGRALFPMMPYTEFSALSEEDGKAIVAYMRTMPPVKNAIPRTEVKFPIGFFIKFAPRPLDGPVAEPDDKDRVAYGKYLAKVTGCQFCHTPVDDHHQTVAGREFAGGQEFPGGIRSANLTPHATGLGARDEQAFIGMFRAWAGTPIEALPKIDPKENTLMPWLVSGHMTDADLGAIYAFLHTLPAIDNAVPKRPGPGSPPAAAPKPAAPTPPAASAAGTPGTVPPAQPTLLQH